MLSLLKVDKNDLGIIQCWLNKDYIKKWYGDSEEWLDEIKNESGEFDWLNHYIVMYGNIPIGFCQYCECSKTPEGFEWDNEPEGTFSIDYLIGEESYLKKGFGSLIIQKLTETIENNETVYQFIADPVPENIVSIKLLEKNGFGLDIVTGLYKKKK